MDWDQSKENIEPLRRGRDAASLLAASQKDDRSKIAEQQRFEEELRSYKGDDPLDVWFRYIKWMEGAYPCGKSGQLRKLVEKCLAAHVRDMDKYDGDPRALYLWIKFAEMSANFGSRNIFEWMRDQNKCTGLAEFWIRYADVFENERDYTRADKIYSEGVRRGAQPLDKLQYAKQQFELRVARQVKERGECGSAEPVDSTRVFLGALAQTKKGQAPHVRHATASGSGSISRVSGSSKTSVTAQWSVHTDSGGDSRDATDKSCQPPVRSLFGSRPVPTKDTDFKENVRTAAQWNQGKRLGLSSAHSGDAGGSVRDRFEVHTDDAGGDQRRCRTFGGSALTEVKEDRAVHPSVALAPPTSHGKKEIRYYPVDKVYGGAIEYSLEELRALLPQYQKKAAAPSNDHTLVHQPQVDDDVHMQSPASGPPATKQRRPLQALEVRKPLHVVAVSAPQDDPMEQGGGADCEPNEPGPAREREHVPSAKTVVSAGSPGNSSLTTNIWHDAMQPFSNTLQFDAQPPNAVAAAEPHRPAVQKATRSKFAVACDDENAPPTGASMRAKVGQVDKQPRPFEVFVDESELSENRAKPAQSVNDENAPAFKKPVQLGDGCKKRAALQPKPVVSEPPPAAAAEPESTFFDANEPTVAGFNRAAPPAGFVASTPAFGMDNVPAPEFDLKFDLGDETLRHAAGADDFFNDGDNCGDNAMQKKQTAGGSAAAAMETDGQGAGAMLTAHSEVDQLQAIQEVSREYYSSGTSSGSDPASCRRRAQMGLRLASTAGHALMPISEQKQLTFTGSSLAVSNAKTPATGPRVPANSRGDVTSSQSKNEPAPCASGEVAAAARLAEDVALQSAVRRLSMNDSARQQQPEQQQNGSDHLPRQVDTTQDCDTTGVGWDTQIKSSINPWDEQLRLRIMNQLEPPLIEYQNCVILEQPAPSVRVGSDLSLPPPAKQCHPAVLRVRRMVGEGAFARAYLCAAPGAPQLVAKVEKPACPWEFYICEELKGRLERMGDGKMVSSVMTITSAYIYDDGSFLLNDYCANGTLLDVVNGFRERGKMGLGEFVTIAYLLEILAIVGATHRAQIVHGDVKPDNFLVLDPPALDTTSTVHFQSNNASSGGNALSAATGARLKLIDWGRAIDMHHMPRGATFVGSSNTADFNCPEMIDDRPWTYQPDLYGVIGTVHLMLFGDYLKGVRKGKDGRWTHNASFRRSWAVPMWRQLYEAVINVPDCEHLPDLSAMFTKMLRERFEQLSCEYPTRCNDDVTLLTQVLDGIRASRL